MNTLKHIVLGGVLVLLVCGIVSAESSISVDPCSIKWYLDETELGKEMQYQTVLVFTFDNTTDSENVSVVIKGIQDKIFYIETETFVDGNITYVYTKLFANVPNDIFHRGHNYSFTIEGTAKYGMYQHIIVSRISVYVEEGNNGVYVITGITVGSIILGVGYIFTNRRKKSYEET